MLTELITGITSNDCLVTQEGGSVVVESQYNEFGTGINKWTSRISAESKSQAFDKLASLAFREILTGLSASTAGIGSIVLGVSILTGENKHFTPLEGWSLVAGGFMTLRIGTALLNRSNAHSIAMEEVSEYS